MNIDSEAWREVFAFAESEISALEKALGPRQEASKTEERRAEIVAWQKVLGLKKPQMQTITRNFWGAR